MSSEQGKPAAAAECLSLPIDSAVWQGLPGSAWSDAAAEHEGSRQRLAVLARTLEREVIPSLLGVHRDEGQRITAPSEAAIQEFVGLLRDAPQGRLEDAVDRWQRAGLPTERLFLDLFAPAARYIGRQWERDEADFSTVTIVLGRLQGLLRAASPRFGREVQHPPNGRRILLAQHVEEQHSFGLSMVAEFYRRAGWEVLGGVAGAVADPTAQVASDWFDAVGFSIGSETKLDWLTQRIVKVRSQTRNPATVILVGGPLIVLDPSRAATVGADAACIDGGMAPRMTEELLAAGNARA
jgi:methanogenic corrinoid protein MtbC1